MATILDNSIQISPYLKKITSSFNSIDKLFKPILGDTNCSIFVSVIIENLTDTTVPKWLKMKLISSGISPLNNLLDFQNYVLLETGYPFTFYDLTKIYLALNNSELNLPRGIKLARMKRFFIVGGDWDKERAAMILSWLASCAPNLLVINLQKLTRNTTNMFIQLLSQPVLANQFKKLTTLVFRRCNVVEEDARRFLFCILPLYQIGRAHV